jgi:hypothetical protein
MRRRRLTRRLMSKIPKNKKNPIPIGKKKKLLTNK